MYSKTSGCMTLLESGISPKLILSLNPNNLDAISEIVWYISFFQGGHQARRFVLEIVISNK